MVVQLFWFFLQSQPDACGLTQMLPFSERDGLAASLCLGSRPGNSLSSAVSLLFLLSFFFVISLCLCVLAGLSSSKVVIRSRLTQPALTSGARRRTEGTQAQTGRRDNDQVLAWGFWKSAWSKVAKSDETKTASHTSQLRCPRGA